MSDRNRAAPAGGTSTAISGPDAVPNGPGTAPVRYSVPEAARLLGISERAVRKRIDAHTLLATRDGRAWSVMLPSGTGTASAAVPAVPAEPRAVPDAEPGPEVAVPGAVPSSVDLAPLAELIERQGQEIRHLTEATTIWQVRALQAEERLKQLTAGDDAPVAAPDAPGRAEGQRPGVGEGSWWRRWLRR